MAFYVSPDGVAVQDVFVSNVYLGCAPGGSLRDHIARGEITIAAETEPCSGPACVELVDHVEGQVDIALAGLLLHLLNYQPLMLTDIDRRPSQLAQLGDRASGLGHHCDHRRAPDLQRTPLQAVQSASDGEQLAELVGLEHSPCRPGCSQPTTLPRARIGFEPAWLDGACSVARLP